LLQQGRVAEALEQDQEVVLDLMSMPSSLYAISERSWLHFLEALQAKPMNLKVWATLCQARRQGFSPIDQLEANQKVRRAGLRPLFVKRSPADADPTR
jgi:hypothetical protein